MDCLGGGRNTKNGLRMTKDELEMKITFCELVKFRLS